MKIAAKAIRTLIVLSLVAGVGYSVSTLMSQPVYASGCDCSAEQREAAIFCLEQFGNAQLDSNYCDQTDGIYLYTCSFDPFLQPRYDYCNDD